MEQLDYALVRLDEWVADDSVPGGAMRGYVALKRTIPHDCCRVGAVAACAPPPVHSHPDAP
jgi:hypothetical protein